MSLQHLLTDIIRTTFLTMVGKHQATKDNAPYGMLMSFSTPTAPEENGYRYFDILIYAPHNYVGVYVRRRWNVIPEADLGPDDEGPLPGKKYDEGEEPWRMIAYHDSGWSEVIERVLREEALLTWSRAASGAGNQGWYGIVNVSNYQLPS